MVRVDVGKEDSIDKVLRRFKSKIKREGILDEIKKREFYEKPNQKRRKRLERAKRREQRRQRDEE